MRAKTTACYCRALDMYYVHAVGCVSFMHYGSTDYALSGDTTEAAPEPCSLQRHLTRGAQSSVDVRALARNNT